MSRAIKLFTFIFLITLFAQDSNQKSYREVASYNNCYDLFKNLTKLDPLEEVRQEIFYYRSIKSRFPVMYEIIKEKQGSIKLYPSKTNPTLKTYDGQVQKLKEIANDGILNEGVFETPDGKLLKIIAGNRYKSFIDELYYLYLSPLFDGPRLYEYGTVLNQKLYFIKMEKIFHSKPSITFKELYSDSHKLIEIVGPNRVDEIVEEASLNWVKTLESRIVASDPDMIISSDGIRWIDVGLWKEERDTKDLIFYSSAYIYEMFQFFKREYGVKRGDLFLSSMFSQLQQSNHFSIDEKTILTKGSLDKFKNYVLNGWKGTSFP